MTNRVCPHCGKSAYGFPICPWCNSSYSLSDTILQSKFDEIPIKQNQINHWTQQFYFFEFLFVVVPATLLILLTFFLLISYSATGYNSNFAFILLILWVGGAMGIYALWSMYFRIYENKLILSITDLPLLAISCGIIANVTPLIYLFRYTNKIGDILFIIYCISPVIVSLHWLLYFYNKSIGSRHTTGR